MVTINEFINNPNIIHTMSMADRQDLANRLDKSRTFRTIYSYSIALRILKQIRTPKIKIVSSNQWPEIGHKYVGNLKLVV